MNNPVPIGFDCKRTWDEDNGDFIFTVSWSVPSSTELLNAISTFDLRVTVVAPHAIIGGTTNQLTVIQKTIDFDVRMRVKLIFPRLNSYIHYGKFFFKLLVDITISHTRMW